MIQEINGIKFKMKEEYDFSFLSEYGKVFKVFDDQDSGNICFGTDNGNERYFVKFAGAKTAEYDGEISDAVSRLKSTVLIYENLKHKNLIEYVESKEINNGFAMIFKWANGECMGRMYPESHRKFMALSSEIKLKVYDDILSFINYIADSGYVAVDFYDGSIMYDFDNQKTIICDIDFFRKAPVINDMGRMWGSSIFMSPEEFELGALMDEITNVYTLGAMAFALFGNYKRDFENWTLSENLYNVAVKAISDDRLNRHQSVEELMNAWNEYNV
ncbi:MAG: serine/threonine protein kinase [Eubacterium sp.]|nr:serine/threonine protein kinase [Eubacterium sp.]